MYTPVVPPYPSPGGGHSPLNPAPPVIPQVSPNNPPVTPAWAQGQTFPAQSPYFMAGVPGSYLVPPVNLPSGTPMMQPQGFSTDFTGFPTPGMTGSAAGGSTPFVRAGAAPGTPYMGGAGSQTAYSNYQQPLPGGQGMPFQMGMMPNMGMGYATPYVMPGAIPAAMPGMPPMQAGMPPMQAGMPPMQGGMPPMQGMPTMGMPGGMPAMGMGYAFTPAAGTVPIPGAGGMPGAPPMQQMPTGGGGRPFQDPREKQPWDHFDKFAEGEDYGPVLNTMLCHRMKAKVEVNPLIMPPTDALDRDYLKWNMLFPSGNCQRSSDRPGRSWHNGRYSPATWPRVTSIRLVSRSFPWSIEIKASNPSLGVTCGDVIEEIHTSMYTRLSQPQYDHASRQQKRLLSESFYHNRSTANGVPGGRLQQTLLRCDWLGQDTMFGGIVFDERLVRDMFRDAFPCTFELKCVRRYPMSEAELREQEAREQDEESRRRRSRSRANSRATSRAGSSRPPTRPPSRAPPDDTDSTSST